MPLAVYSWVLMCIVCTHVHLTTAERSVRSALCIRVYTRVDYGWEVGAVCLCARRMYE